MADPGTPEWWLDRLYKRLIARRPQIKAWDDWFTGSHPVPLGYEDADDLMARIMDTVGLNMCQVVTVAALDRLEVIGFANGRTSNSDVWAIWQANNFDLGSEQVRQEKMALSEAYVMVAPDRELGARLTPEHPEQCIVEMQPGDRRKPIAALKVWQDDTGAKPVVHAWLDLGTQIYRYQAPTRAYADGRQMFAMQPAWELQASLSGPNPLGQVSLIPFPNGGRMLNAPLPEFYPALAPQKRINKTLLDRMAMQDQGAFKAMWATGIKIPRDPVTKQPVETFVKALDRVFINENEKGKFGQMQAEDIKQMLEACNEDIAAAAIAVPTSPDQIMSKLVNVSGDGLKLAQVSEVKRVKRHLRQESEPWEDVARLTLKAAGKTVPNAERMKTLWANPEYRTDTEQTNAAVIARKAGMPAEIAWKKYLGADDDDVKDWKALLAAERIGPVEQAIIDGVTRDASNPDLSA